MVYPQNLPLASPIIANCEVPFEKNVAGKNSGSLIYPIMNFELFFFFGALQAHTV